MKPRAKDLAQPSNEARNNDPESSEEKGNSKEHEVPLLLEEATSEEVAQDREEKGDELAVLGHAPELLAPRENFKGKDKVVVELANEDAGYSSFPLTVPIKRKKRSMTDLVDATEAPSRAATPRAGQMRTTQLAPRIDEEGLERPQTLKNR